jgi:hypothetical protein
MGQTIQNETLLLPTIKDGIGSSKRMLDEPHKFRHQVKGVSKHGMRNFNLQSQRSMARYLGKNPPVMC